MTGSDHVLALAGLGVGDRPLAGGKAASLGELSRAGFRVPDGYVVTTLAFKRAVAALGAQAGSGMIPAEIEQLSADDHAEIERVTARIRRRLRGAALPPDLGAAIASHYRALGGDAADAGGAAEAGGAADAVGDAAAAVAGGAVGGAGLAGLPVAVRSSATTEDSSDASFAGLQDTYLWVRGEEAVAEHVRKCWASLYSVESVSYRRRMGQQEAALAMGVVVQRMVDARCSGVMFTRSPTTGDRSVIALEASWGLGSAVVSGAVTPDTYLVSKVTGEIIKCRIAVKVHQHRMASGGDGVVEEEVPAELQGAACLSDGEIYELVRIARKVEEHYGAPQDIEWAIARDGTGRHGTGRHGTGHHGTGHHDAARDGAARESVFLLQSRPETVWANRERGPVAAPKQKAFDHVFELLGKSFPS